MSHVSIGRVTMPDTIISNRYSHPVDQALAKKALREAIGYDVLIHQGVEVLTEFATTRRNTKLFYRDGRHITVSGDPETNEEKRAEVYYPYPYGVPDHAEIIVDILRECIDVDKIELSIFTPRDGGYYSFAFTISIPRSMPPFVKSRYFTYSYDIPGLEKYKNEKEITFWNNYQKRTTLFFELLSQIE